MTTVQDFQKISAWSRKKIYLYLDTYGSLAHEQRHGGLSGEGVKVDKLQLIPFQLAQNMLLEEQKQALKLRGAQFTYFEGDTYVDATKFAHFPHRPLVVALTGHDAHGKRALFHALGYSASAMNESAYSIRTLLHSLPAGLTDKIRELFPPKDNAYQCKLSHCTVIDTPGHMSCAETRLHGIRVADVLAVVLSLEAGVSDQAREAVQIARELKKKMVFLVTNERQAPHNTSTCMHKILQDLRKIGVDIRSHVPGKAQLAVKTSPLLYLPSLSADEVCNAVDQIVLLAYPKAVRAPQSALSEKPQAVIVSSFRDLETGEFACQVIVRNGVLRPGMWFLADFNFGQIIELRSAREEKVSSLRAGFPGFLSGLRMSGCPSVGAHVLVMDSGELAKRAAAFRTQLAWYVQRFPKLTHLLRPKGLPTHFHHVGNFGQITDDTSLEHRLCYGESNAAGRPQDSIDGRSQDNLLGNSQENTPNAWPLQKQSTTSAISPHESSQPAPVEWRCVLLTKSLHLVRILMREMHKCGSKDLKVSVSASFVGPMREQVVRTAVQARVNAIVCFETVLLDAAAEMFAEQKEMPIKAFDCMDSLLEFVRDDAQRVFRDAAEAETFTARTVFAANFIPKF